VATYAIFICGDELEKVMGHFYDYGKSAQDILIHWQREFRRLALQMKAIWRSYQGILLGELHLSQELLEAGIGMEGIEPGILMEPVHATSALISLVQPLKCPILVA
jgi:hypothetical protein